MQQMTKSNYKCSVPQRQTVLRTAKPSIARTQHYRSQVSSSSAVEQHPAIVCHHLLEGPGSFWAAGSCQLKALPPSAIDHPSRSHPSSTEMNCSWQLELLSVDLYLGTQEHGMGGIQGKQRWWNKIKDKAVPHAEVSGTCTAAIPP